MRPYQKNLMKKGMVIFCAGLLLTAPATAVAAGGSGSDSIQVPADATSGGVIHSNIYGEVLVTRQENGTYNYTFFDDDRPAVKELLAALNAGQKIDLDKLLTESSTSIQKITKEDGTAIPNDIANSGAAASDNRGSFSVGSVYGPDLNATEIQQVQTAVSSFLIQNNVASMSDVKKVRAAHDFLVQTCVLAPKGNKNHADDAWGALIYHEANAKGYARAMKALCDAMGVGSYIISANNSSALKDYMWNVVMINGEWYIVDVYCDDGTSSYITYLVSDSAYRALGMNWNTGSNIPVCKKNYDG